MFRRSMVRVGLAVTAATAVIAGAPALAEQVGLGQARTAEMPMAYEAERALDGDNAARSQESVLAAEAERKAKAKAAAKRRAEAKRRAAAEAKAARARAIGTPAGNRALGLQMCADKGWSAGQCADLVKLWNRESGWSATAHNSGSGAHGIPQALPGSKMAAFGDDWATSARTQIAWGLDYIARAYGNPSRAWAHSQANGWY